MHTWGKFSNCGNAQKLLLERLWEALGITFQVDVVNEKLESEIKIKGMNNKLHCRYLQVKKILEIDEEGTGPLFPAEQNASSKELEKQDELLTLERAQVYEKLYSDTSAEEIKTVYSLMDISKSEKLKKRQLALALWSSPEKANASAKGFLTIFPELKRTASMRTLQPSKKAFRRIGHADKTLSSFPWDKTVFGLTLKDDLVKENIAAFSLSCFSGMQQMMQGGKRFMEKEETPFDRQCKAISRGRAWKQVRYIIVMEYLNGK
eukprot:CAMPEP_0118705292 /NCGR_PEP_ID=MMETSP0800-20121206/19789_1 /TAXON_ID=210618 ORGANISM="Striatella unipunctata, Strain CCMP2910" /NCGR_SAMPLE_ID=MMETSP0800 /ASSEMBLY_ACC=CAM_ASM_000638 /LENGTH=262 /DNA_ID=CAMNT_0006607435 /DNA_START=58 /DNA_END=846 /DNA_ORIENTATION=-